MLTDTEIRAVKPAHKPQKLFDEKGLFLLVQPTGGKLWRLKYRFPNRGPNKKERQLALGIYPEVSLRQARDRRDEARKQIANGIDPGVKRQCEKRASSDSFKAVALELFAVLRKSSVAGEEPPEHAAEVTQRTIQPHRKRKVRQREPISADTIDTMERRLEMHVFPHIGAQDVREVSAPSLLKVLRRIEERGTFELAHRVRSICSRVFRYANASGRTCQDVAKELTGLLVPVQSEPMATITEPEKIGSLLRSIEGYHGEPITRLALKLRPYVFTRPIEFRTMEWAHLNLDSDTPDWRVPWKRMKMRDPHIVPLSRQAVAILREIHSLSGRRRYVFPCVRKRDKPMSENCITAALRTMGYSGADMTDHGFRALASTQLHELGWNEKWIEMQLAHMERNKSKRPYNHAKYLPQRRLMMQAWADYLDRLREGKGALPIVTAESVAQFAAMRALGDSNGTRGLLSSPVSSPSLSVTGWHVASGASDPNSGAVSREWYVDWCKQRALEFVSQGNLSEAITSIFSDLQKHPATANREFVESGMRMLMDGQLSTPEKMREFINAVT